MPDDLEELARRHLWMHFTRLGPLADRPVPIIERGHGSYIWDHNGRRYLDGLSGLFTSNIGHGRPDVARVASEQAEALAYYPIWSHAHPPAIRLAARLAALAPGDLNRVFFTSGGSEAVESAWKFARQYHLVRGDTERRKIIARSTAYHGMTLGALSITGIPSLRDPFEPLLANVTHVPNTNAYRPVVEGDDATLAAHCADAIDEAIEREGPETVAAVILEPMQNGGGCFTPPADYFARVREICDRHGVLLISDEVICGFGRLGEWFGCQRYGYQPDLVTVAKGLTAGYAPLGGVLISDRLAEPFLDEGTAFLHGFTFGGHPVSCAVADAVLDVYEREGLLAHVRDREPAFLARLNSLGDLPIVGDVRGAGFFYAIEVVKDQATKARFDDAERDRLLRTFLWPRMVEAGLIVRVDDRGDPIIQVCPPLVGDDDEFAHIETTLRTVLAEASKEFT